MKQLSKTVIEAAKLYEAQNYSETIAILNKYLQSSDDCEAYNLRGMTNYAAANLEQALEDLNRAVFLEPENTTFLNNLAIAYLNSDQQKALKIFQDILNIDENAFDTYKSLGMYYTKNGYIKEAITCYEKLLQAKQIDFNVATNYAKLLCDMGQPGHSVQYINYALDIDKDNPHLHLLAADVFFKMQSPVEATTYYKNFLALSNQKMDNYIFHKVKKGWSTYAKAHYRFHKIKEKSYRDAYGKAIKESVKDKVVLEYGRNGGMFAMMAADAGAKKVYVCEEDKSIAAQIQEVIKTNNFENIIEIINANIYKIEGLKADIAIIDRFGNYVVDENILTDIAYIKRELLTDTGEMIPKEASLYGMTVNVPSLQKQEYIYNMKGFSIYEAPYVEKNINELKYTKTSQTFKIFDFDLYDPKDINNVQIKPSYLHSSTNGVVIWFNLNFGNIEVETFNDSSNHYQQLIWTLEENNNTILEFIHEKSMLFVNDIS